MTELNDKEMTRMQQEAKARVMEMKNRSRIYAAQMNQSLNDPPEQGQTQRQNEAFAEEVRERQKADPQPTPAAPEPAKKAPDHRDETLFLLALFALMREDGGDQLLPLLILSLL